jgi:hypothetical protein
VTRWRLPEQLVAIATGAARLSVPRRSWGSVAAGAVRDSCCRSIYGHLQREGEVASQLPLDQHEMEALVSVATGAARLRVRRRSWGSVAAGAVRDSCCRRISVHLQREGEVASQLPLEQHEMEAARAAHVSCYRSSTTQSPSEKLGDPLPPVQCVIVVAGAFLFICSARV